MHYGIENMTRARLIVFWTSHRLDLAKHNCSSCEQFYRQTKEVMNFTIEAGLSCCQGGRGFSPATKRVVPGYFYWKIEEK